MSSLQESRRELMVQLEGLMKLLKVTHTHTHTDYCFQHGALSHYRAKSPFFLYTSFFPVLAVTSLTFLSAVSPLVISPFFSSDCI